MTVVKEPVKKIQTPKPEDAPVFAPPIRVPEAAPVERELVPVRTTGGSGSASGRGA